MAQPIHCDAHNREHLADVLVSQIANGDTAAFCFPGYVEVCRALVADVEAQAAEAAKVIEAEAIASGAADQAEADQAAADVAERLAGGLVAQGMDATEAAIYATESTAAMLGQASLDPTPATVVRKGTSRSRRAHEARQRAARAKVAPVATEPADAAQASTDAATEEPGGGELPA